MRKPNYPTQSELKELFTYDGENLIYNERNTGSRGDKRFNTMYAGKKAGCLKKDGYVHITINKRTFLRSNLIYIFLNGKIQEGKTIDHKNRDTTDDNSSNHRTANRSEQGYNQSHEKHKKSGLPRGVFKIVAGSGNIFYQAKIRFNGKRKYLGTFDTIDTASNAYKAAQKKLHGEFALEY